MTYLPREQDTATRTEHIIPAPNIPEIRFVPARPSAKSIVARAKNSTLSSKATTNREMIHFFKKEVAVVPQDYYHRIFHRLETCFSHYDYFIAPGNELVAEGCDPAEENANYRARVYSAVALWQTGRLAMPDMGNDV